MRRTATGAVWLWQEPPRLNQWKQPLELAITAAAAVRTSSLFMNRTSSKDCTSRRGSGSNNSTPLYVMCKRNVMFFCAINVADSARHWRKRVRMYEVNLAVRAGREIPRPSIGPRTSASNCPPDGCTFAEGLRQRVSFTAHLRPPMRPRWIARLRARERRPGLARFMPRISAPRCHLRRSNRRTSTKTNRCRTPATSYSAAAAATACGEGSMLRLVGVTAIAPAPSAELTDAAPASADEGVAPNTVGPPGTDDLVETIAPHEADLTADADAELRANELWIVSTRELPDAGCGCPSPEFAPQVEQYHCGSGWVRSTLAQFVAGDQVPGATVVFIHGNDTDKHEAEARGRQLYRQLHASRCPLPPTRLVIWSWPSERVVPRYRKDAQLKVCRTNIEGYYLARFVDLLSANTAVSLAGYSFGAPIVTGGLHLLGGGVLEGRQLVDRQHPDRQPARAMLLGGAMSNSWLLPGRRHDRALSQVDRMVIFFNPKDVVLHWYPWLWGRGGSEALGRTGIAAPSRLGPERAKVAQINVQRQMHHRHGWDYFARSPSIMSAIWRETSHQSTAGGVSQ